MKRAALSPWLEELAHLDAALSAPLQAWLPALDGMIAPWPVQNRHLEGEPDGYDRLTHRGSYERLLLSEWGLLDAAPDEFIRRAASGEHVFHELRKVAQTFGQRSVALFDVGPSQWGAPRLAHLALLFVLSARARKAGVPFFWGFLHDPQQRLHEGLSAQKLMFFLAQSTSGAPSDVSLGAWRNSLPKQRDVKLDELWTVTAAAVRALLPMAREIFVKECDDPYQSQVIVTAGSDGGRRQVALELPEPTVAARMLKEPVVVTSTPATRPSIRATAIAFSPTGTRLLVRSSPETIVNVDFPFAGTPPRKRQSINAATGTTILAALSKRGSSYWVGVNGRQALLGVKGSKASTVTLSGFDLAEAAPSYFSPMVIGDGDTLWFADHLWRMFKVKISARTITKMGIEGARTVGWAAPSSFPVLAELHNGEVSITAYARSGARGLFKMQGLGRTSRAFISMAQANTIKLVALTSGDGTWRLFGQWNWKDGTEWIQPHGTQVYGAAMVKGSPCLLLSGSDEQSLHLMGPNTSHHLHTFSRPIMDACLQPHGRHIAALVDAGVWVLDHTGSIVLTPDRVNA